MAPTGPARVLSSPVLSCLFVPHRDIVRGKRVVELGAGLGLVSLAAAQAGAAEVVATDGDADVLPMLHENIARHGEVAPSDPQESSDSGSYPAVIVDSVPVRVQRLFWGDDGDIARVSRADVILGADVAACPYEEAYQALVDTCVRLQPGDRGSAAPLWLCYKARQASEAGFFDRLHRRFRMDEEVPPNEFHPDFRRGDGASARQTYSSSRAEDSPEFGRIRLLRYIALCD